MYPSYFFFEVALLSCPLCSFLCTLFSYFSFSSLVTVPLIYSSFSFPGEDLSGSGLYAAAASVRASIQGFDL